MQFKQFFIALCALILVFSACKKDEDPFDITGSWNTVTIVTSGCNNPGENSTVDALDLACTPNPDNCEEFKVEFKDDATFTVNVVSFVDGQDLSETYSGTYTFTETEVEICYSPTDCSTGTITDGLVSIFSDPHPDTNCQIEYILEKQ